MSFSRQVIVSIILGLCFFLAQAATAQTCEERLNAARNELQAALTIDGTFIFPRWKQDLLQIVILQQQAAQAQAEMQRLREEVEALKKPAANKGKGEK